MKNLWVCAQKPPGSRQGEGEEEGKRKVFCVKLTVSNVFLNNSCASRRKWLQEVYNVIDSRYRSRKPLIVTTNLTLDSLQNPLDTAHARIYDRLLEMCAPILFTGENFRRETAQAKLNRLKELMK